MMIKHHDGAIVMARIELTEGGDADVMEAIYRSLMEACIAYEHREFARLREPATAGSAA